MTTEETEQHPPSDLDRFIESENNRFEVKRVRFGNYLNGLLKKYWKDPDMKEVIHHAIESNNER